MLRVLVICLLDRTCNGAAGVGHKVPGQALIGELGHRIPHAQVSKTLSVQVLEQELPVAGGNIHRTCATGCSIQVDSVYPVLCTVRNARQNNYLSIC